MKIYLLIVLTFFLSCSNKNQLSKEETIINKADSIASIESYFDAMNYIDDFYNEDSSNVYINLKYCEFIQLDYYAGGMEDKSCFNKLERIFNYTMQLPDKSWVNENFEFKELQDYWNSSSKSVRSDFMLWVIQEKMDKNSDIAPSL